MKTGEWRHHAAAKGTKRRTGAVDLLGVELRGTIFLNGWYVNEKPIVWENARNLQFSVWSYVHLPSKFFDVFVDLTKVLINTIKRCLLEVLFRKCWSPTVLKEKEWYELRMSSLVVQMLTRRASVSCIGSPTFLTCIDDIFKSVHSGK